ncbi:M56 family metallopeptidase [Planctomycetaceae bacterium SH139]
MQTHFELNWLAVIWLCGGLQAAVILAISWVWAKRQLDRAPAVAARTCGCGLLLSSLLIGGSFLPLPRPVAVPVDWFGAGWGESSAESARAELTRADGMMADGVMTDGVMTDATFSAGDPANVDGMAGEQNSAVSRMGLGVDARTALAWLPRWARVADGGWLPRAAGWGLLVAGCFAALVGLRIVLGIFTALKLYRSSVMVPQFQWPAGVQQFVKRHPRFGAVELRVHLAVASPCVHAFSRRVVYVPPEFFLWSELESETAFAHEVAHLFRRDPLWRFCSELGMLLLAMQPLAYLVRKQFTLAQEMATDQLAATLLRSPQGYRRGLVQLCLRLDQGQPSLRSRFRFCIGVSGISNGLIRRIKMLHGQEGNQRLQAKSGLGWPTAGAAIGLTMLTLVVGSWTLRADEPQQGDEPVRVATRPLDSKSLPPTPFFQGSKAHTDERFPLSEGVWEVDIERLFQHPLVSAAVSQEVLDALCEPRADGTRPAAADFGLRLSSLKTLRFAPALTLSFEPRNERPMSFEMGASGGVIQSTQEVDWPALVQALSVEHFGPSVSVADRDALVSQLAVGKELAIGCDEPGENSSQPNPQLALLWQQVAGGAITLVAKAPPIPDVGDAELTQEYQTSLEVADQFAALGLGIDLDPTSPLVSVRIGLTGKPGVATADMLVAVESLRTLMLSNVDRDTVRGKMLAGKIEAAVPKVIAEDAAGSTLLIELELDPIATFLLN